MRMIHDHMVTLLQQKFPLKSGMNDMNILFKSFQYLKSYKVATDSRPIKKQVKINQIKKAGSYQKMLTLSKDIKENNKKQMKINKISNRLYIQQSKNTMANMKLNRQMLSFINNDNFFDHASEYNSSNQSYNNQICSEKQLISDENKQNDQQNQVLRNRKTQYLNLVQQNGFQNTNDISNCEFNPVSSKIKQFMVQKDRNSDQTHQNTARLSFLQIRNLWTNPNVGQIISRRDSSNSLSTQEQINIQQEQNNQQLDNEENVQNEDSFYSFYQDINESEQQQNFQQQLDSFQTNLQATN